MFKEQHKETLAQYEKLWERKNDRCILNLTYTKEGAVAFPEPQSLQQQWLDENYILNKYKHNLAQTGYVAEGISHLFTNFGPGCLSACIGGEYELAPRTVWFDRQQFVKDWANPPALTFNENSEMWQHVLRLQSHFMSDPDVMFSITDLGGIMDIVASLRTTEELLYDLYDYPEEVKAFAKQVKTLWFKAFDKQVETIRKTGLPYNNWMNIPSEKPWYPLQCDFCYMLSPKHFEEFVLDDLVDQVNHMERSIYHLDGIGEIPHLDMLLDIPNLTGIQWVAGDGQPALINEAWLDLYKRIKDKKKNLVLMVKSTFTEADMPQLEKFIKSVDPVGTYISTHCASRKVAEEVLENVIKWTK